MESQFWTYIYLQTVTQSNIMIYTQPWKGFKNSAEKKSLVEPQRQNVWVKPIVEGKIKGDKGRESTNEV